MGYSRKEQERTQCFQRDLGSFKCLDAHWDYVCGTTLDGGYQVVWDQFFYGFTNQVEGV